MFIKKGLKCLLIFSTFLQGPTLFSQSKFHPYAGLHASMNGDGFYVGPSYQAGTDYQLEKKVVLSFYAHYFPCKVNDIFDGLSESGKYKSLTTALLLQTHLSKKTGKGIFAGLGLAFQRVSENYEREDFYKEHYKENMLVGAFRFGYLFSFSGYGLAIELNGTGPHTTKDRDTGDIEKIQLLTQLSLGARFIL